MSAHYMVAHKRFKYEPIKIKEPHKGDVKMFNDPDEFTQYYREHENEFKNVSTLILNRTYKIPGYRISITHKGKDDEELILKKDYYGQSVKKSVVDGDVECDAVREEIAVINERLANIEQFLSQIKNI